MLGVRVRSPIRGRRCVHQPRNRGPAPAGARNAKSNRPTWLPVFQHRGGTPPIKWIKVSGCFSGSPWRGGPDRRRLGPHRATILSVGSKRQRRIPQGPGSTLIHTLGRKTMAAVAERSHADILPDPPLAPDPVFVTMPLSVDPVQRPGSVGTRHGQE